MNVEEDKKQHDYNGNQNAARRKGSGILNQMNKKGKKTLIKLFKMLPLKVRIALIVVVAAIGGLLFFAMSFYVVDKDKEDKTNDAAATAISTSYSPNASITGTDTSGNTFNKVVVTTNDTKTDYEVAYNDDSKYLETVRHKLEHDGIVKSALKFTDFEIAVIGALLESGANFDSYTENELHCFSSFIKAEAATQNLDLRPNSEKESGKNVGDYIENYQPEKIENIEENEVPGVILVQRTNTNTTTPITLEYKILSDFQNLIQNNDPNARNYFSIDENGNLLIAKWDHILITVNGEYPENLPESEKDIPTGEEGRYILKAEPIAYSQYISEYTMPFEFLVQLLVTTDEPEFCMELAKCAFDSKIVIDIQEEETVTVTTEEKTYETYYKEEKKVDYNIEPNVEIKTNYLIRTKDGNVIIDDNQTDCTIDDTGEACTIYEYEKSQEPVKVTTTRTEHTYKFEIIEADNWLVRYIKDYKTGYDISKEKIETTPIKNETVQYLGTYKSAEEKVLTNSEEILKDAHAELFKQEKEKYYKNKVVVPQVSVKDGQDAGNSYWKQINIEDLGTKFETSLGAIDTKYQRISGINSNGDITYAYFMPSEFTVTTINTEDLIGGITYRYNLSNNYTYSLTNTNIDDVIKCNISKLVLTPYNKINTTTVTNQKVTKFPANDNPIKKTEIYTVDSNGEFVKFLKAYDNSKGAQNNLNSIDSWLYEMMEDRTSTEKLVDYIKYLLTEYDGVDRGITELNLDVFNSSEFETLTSGSGWWWPIGSSNVEIINRVEFARGEPIPTRITSGVGPRWGKNHGGIDIANGIRGTNIIASKSGTVITVVDGFGDGYYGSSDGGGYGNHVMIQHDDGTYSLYAHLERGTIKVSQGERVEQGQVLGGMGTSGSSTGIHLHFEIRDPNNNRLDPEEFVDSKNPRQMLAISSLRDWLWKMEGGSQYINGNVWTVFDPEGDDDTMNLAHGMVIASYNGADSWYPDIIPGKITVGQFVTADKANQIWEKKIKGFNDAIDSACAKYGVTLTPNQKDALVSYIYRTGYGAGQNNLIVSAYASRGNAGLWDYMKKGYDKRAEYEAGTKKRVAEEYELFVKGDYNYNPNGTAKYDQYCNNPNI